MGYYFGVSYFRKPPSKASFEAPAFLRGCFKLVRTSFKARVGLEFWVLGYRILKFRVLVGIDSLKASFNLRKPLGATVTATIRFSNPHTLALNPPL